MVGNSYKFKVRAKNIYGFGPFSPEVTLFAYDFPAQPAIMTTQVIGTNVRLTFTPPASNGSAITSYQILIEHSGGSFAEDPACIASAEPVFSQRYCDLPMANFLTAPYNLAQGTLIRAKVKATNEVGDSQFSQVNNSGADVKTVPW